MSKPTLLLLYNQPQLAPDHPDAESEHTVLETATELTQILREQYDVVPFALGPDPAPLWDILRGQKPDVVFNLFEGNPGNPETESFVAGLLDWSGVPYTGSPFSALCLARAKHTTKYLLKGAGFPTARFQVLDHLPAPDCGLDFPVIVKPATQDASVGIDQESVCPTPAQLRKRVEYVFKTYGPPVIVEEYLAGRELHVTVIELPNLKALPPAEVVFQSNGQSRWPIFTYADKWNAAQDLRMPTDLPSDLVHELERIAIGAFRLLGCRDYARVDFRLKANGAPHILEVNPNPEICDHVGLTGCLAASGIAHREFILRIAHQALSRSGNKRI